MKLFVTVGTQFPFDRLIRTVDAWAGRNPFADVFAQIGPSRCVPRHFRWAPFIEAAECRRQVEKADVIIAHAGMGSIITALELGKPIVVMPRRAILDEHRNEHQMATARSLLARGKVIVAFDEAHLSEKLDHLEHLVGSREVSAHASPRLLATLRQFVATGAAPARFTTATPSRDDEVFAITADTLHPTIYRAHEIDVLVNQPSVG